ncbi:M48 family peptidase (plasmid) [Fulvitalea axinellae]|uniref:M48 family peptidase n=1 Tax=Fulvitalea axinellae TaxID=1182444 RepID=A0AAU9D294_9BACT|nr:M48 family peptidase [Fulvitalea axinellae]
MRLIFLFVLLWISSEAFSQTATHYSFGDKAKERQIEKMWEDALNKGIGRMSGKFKRQKQKIYISQLERFNENLKDSVFIFNADLHTYVSNVCEKIFHNNPGLKPANFDIYFNTSIFPNATAYGNGCIVINLGLFELLESEDELAFVLCHELAHESLRHTEKGIDNRIKTLNSEELKEKIANAKMAEESLRNTRLNLLQDLAFNFSKRSREVELEADAKGKEYFSKTKYSESACVTALEKLGALEELVLNRREDWEGLFNRNGYTFSFSLLQKDESLFDSDEVIDDFNWKVDSLRTHPHIKERVEKLGKVNKEWSSPISDLYARKKRLAYQLALSASMDKKEYDFAFYLASIKLQQDEDAKVYYQALDDVFQKIEFHKRSRTLGLHIPQPNHLRNEVHIDEVRRLLYNVGLTELQRLRRVVSNQEEHTN